MHRCNADSLYWRLHRAILHTCHFASLSLQKIEEPVRSTFPEGSDSGAQNFGPSQGEADDFLKSKTANQDTEILGTEVGVADAMRFKGAGTTEIPDILYQEF